MQYRRLAVAVAVVILLAVLGALAPAHQAHQPTELSHSVLDSNGTFGQQVVVAATAKSTTVYITKTGKKFHKGTCRHLSKSKIAIKRADAVKRGFSACKVCKP